MPVFFFWTFPRFVIAVMKAGYSVARAIKWTWTKKVIPVLWKICKTCFISIHSEIRLLCMTDAILGVLAGYYSGHALIGGIVGAILGVFNYELISKRALKLVPT
jgi:hypothetical protein